MVWVIDDGSMLFIGVESSKSWGEYEYEYEYANRSIINDEIMLRLRDRSAVQMDMDLFFTAIVNGIDV